MVSWFQAFDFKCNLYRYSSGYGRLGLGSDGTDEIVRLVQSLGPRRGLFGAKITGGGSGGTVCVLGRSDGSGAAAVAEVCEAGGGLHPYKHHFLTNPCRIIQCLRAYTSVYAACTSVSTQHVHQCLRRMCISVYAVCTSVSTYVPSSSQHLRALCFLRRLTARRTSGPRGGRRTCSRARRSEPWRSTTSGCRCCLEER